MWDVVVKAERSDGGRGEWRESDVEQRCEWDGNTAAEGVS